MAVPAREQDVVKLPARSTETRLEELAYQQGRRDADVDARLLSHDRHLNRLDGWVERQTNKAEELGRSIDDTRESLEDKIDQVIAAQHARDAVEADREHQTQRSTQSLFNRRTLLIGFWTVVAMLLAVVVSVIALALTVH